MRFDSMPLTHVPDPVVPATAPVPTNEYVQIPVAELARFQAAQAQLDEHRRQSAYQVAEQNTRLMATEGRIGDLTRQHQQELSAKDERVRQVTVAAELSRALASHQLADPSCGEQLSLILAKELTATEGPNGLEVRSKDYKHVSEFIKETLAKPTFQHFLAQNARQTQAPAQTQAAPQFPYSPQAQQAPPIGLPDAPRSLGEAIVLAGMNRVAAASSVDPRLTGGSTVADGGPIGPGGRRVAAQPSAAFGLRLPGR
jgi:hypothetical protein